MTDATVDRLSRELLDWYMEWNPLFATGLGNHAYDDRMPRGTNEAELEERSKLKAFLERVEDIGSRGLSPAKRIDVAVLRNTLRLALFRSEELNIWQSMPDGAETAAEALFMLFMRDFAPLPRRLESITGRLEAIPTFLRETKTRIRAPVTLWCEIGRESSRHVPAFFQVIQSAGKEALASPDRRRLDEAVAKASEAVEGYRRWIDTELLPNATVRVGIGATKFRRLVRLRELGLSVDEIYAIGKRYLRESKAELARIARQIRKGATVEAARKIVKADHPADFPAAIAYTAAAMNDSRRFVIEHGLASVPPNEDLKVMETPSYLRHIIPFAAYSPPGRFESRAQGIYIVTAYPDKPEMLQEFGYPHVRNTAVHEGYPGHHLQLVCANRNPSLARAFAHAVESIEGWAHYCEQMMQEAGFGADPSTKFVQITDQIWRACRIIIDVDLHRGRMTVDGAVDFLIRESGMERPAALAEVKRYTYNPAYQLSYLIGKHLILGLRRDVKRGLGRSYSDRLFHDTFLYAGSLPMKHMRSVFEHKIRELRHIERTVGRVSRKRPG